MKRQLEKDVKVLVVDVGGPHVKCIATGRHNRVAEEASA